MGYKAQIDDRGQITRYKDTDTGEVISAREFERRIMSQHGHYMMTPQQGGLPQMYAASGDPSQQQAMPMQQQGGSPYATGPAPLFMASQQQQQPQQGGGYATSPAMGGAPVGAPMAPPVQAPAQVPPESPGANPLIQPGAQMLNGSQDAAGAPAAAGPQAQGQAQGQQGKNLRLEGVAGHVPKSTVGTRTHGFLDATSIAILLPTLVLLALIIAAAHKKRLFPWQTIRTFNPPSGLMSPRDYERSFVCPPNLRRHGRMGKRNPQATWTDADGIVIPFGFLARTHLPVTIPLGRLPNKNMFLVAPSGSGKTTLMRAIMKALLAKPCVMIALEAKANDPNLDEKKEGFRYTILPEARAAGFDALYFNPLDMESIHWNPLDLDATHFASSIVQDVNSLPPEEQHWAERDHGYISGLTRLLKWGAVQVAGEDGDGNAAEVRQLPCNPRGLMRLVNNRRNIVESLRRLKNNPDIDPGDLNELTLCLSSIIRTDTDWDKNIQGVRGRLRMFRNEHVLRVTEQSNIDLKASMHRPTVLIFGAPASLGPDAESLAACFVYQMQQALHTRYGTASVLPLFAFFDEYQTLNIDLAGRLSAIVRGANGGLAVILQNISQIARTTSSSDPTSGGASELKTLFSNCAVRVCLHNADDSTAMFFANEIGKHAVIVPGISDHYESNGFGIFPTSWNRIHSQQVVPRVDQDSIKRMEKQHALVYLSPAGDPEFGETKPFMVDLRGIEEIARLHLLHNVSGRQPGPEGDGGGGGGNNPPAFGPMPTGPVASPVDMVDPGAILSTSAAIINSMPEDQGQYISTAPVAQQEAAPAFVSGPGSRPFPFAQATPTPMGPAPTSQAPDFPSAAQGLAAPAAAAVTNAGAGILGAAPQQPPFPGSTPAPVTQQPVAPQQVMPQQPAPQQMQQIAPQQPALQQAAPQQAAGAKNCPHCNKPAGKGRFCIECGKFVGASAPAATPAPAAAEQPQSLRSAVQDFSAALPNTKFGQYGTAPESKPTFPYQEAQPQQTAAPQASNQFGQQAPTPQGPQQGPQGHGQQAPQAKGRGPVTTMHADMSKFGVPQGGKPTGKKAGIEF